jgi:hypothetical protein
VQERNKDKIILDLCGGTGSWSQPYRDAGYDVRLVTLPDSDVREYVSPDDVYGILAAPPCTHFTNSGAQYWKIKDQDGRTLADTQIITHCLRVIALAQPKFWVMENPTGRFGKWMGKPQLVFNPCDYGDPYTKRTCSWGRFVHPVKNPVDPEFVIASNGDRYSKVFMATGGSSARTKDIRSVTPPGFAKAFLRQIPKSSTYSVRDFLTSLRVSRSHDHPSRVSIFPMSHTWGTLSQLRELKGRIP